MRTFDSTDYVKSLQAEKQKDAARINAATQKELFQLETRDLNYHPFYISYAQSVEDITNAIFVMDKHVEQYKITYQQATLQWRQYLQRKMQTAPEGADTNAFKTMLLVTFAKQEQFVEDWIARRRTTAIQLADIWDLDFPDLPDFQNLEKDLSVLRGSPLKDACKIPKINNVNTALAAQEAYVAIHISDTKNEQVQKKNVQDAVQKALVDLPAISCATSMEQISTAPNACQSYNWRCLLKTHAAVSLQMHKTRFQITHIEELLTYEKTRLQLLLMQTQFDSNNALTLQLSQTVANLETLRQKLLNLHVTQKFDAFQKLHVMWHESVHGMFVAECAKLIAYESHPDVSKRRDKLIARVNIATQYLEFEEQLQNTLSNHACMDGMLAFVEHVKLCVYSSDMCTPIINLKSLENDALLATCAYVKADKNQESLQKDLMNLKTRADSLSSQYAKLCESQNDPILFRACLLQYLTLVNARLDANILQSDLALIPQSTFVEEINASLTSVTNSPITHALNVDSFKTQLSILLTQANLQEQMAQQDFSQSRKTVFEDIAFAHLSYAARIVDILQKLIASTLASAHATDQVQLMQTQVTSSLKNLQDMPETSVLRNYIFKQVLSSHIMFQATLIQSILTLLKKNITIAITSPPAIVTTTAATTTTTPTTTTTSTTTTTTTTTSTFATTPTTTSATTTTSVTTTTTTTTAEQNSIKMHQKLVDHDPRPDCFKIFKPTGNTNVQELRSACVTNKCDGNFNSKECSDLILSYRNLVPPLEITKHPILETRMVKIVNIQEQLLNAESRLKTLREYDVKVLSPSEIQDAESLLVQSQELHTQLLAQETEYQNLVSDLQKLIPMPEKTPLSNNQCKYETFPMDFHHVFEQQSQYLARCQQECATTDDACVQNLKMAYNMVKSDFQENLTEKSRRFLTDRFLVLLAELQAAKDAIAQNAEALWTTNALEEVENLQQTRKTILIPHQDALLKELQDATKHYDEEALSTTMFLLRPLEQTSTCTEFLDGFHTYEEDRKFIVRCENDNKATKTSEFIREYTQARLAVAETVLQKQFQQLQAIILEEKNELSLQSEASITARLQFTSADTIDEKIQLHSQLQKLHLEHATLEAKYNDLKLQRDAMQLEVYLQLLDAQTPDVGIVSVPLDPSNLCDQFGAHPLATECVDRQCTFDKTEACWDLIAKASLFKLQEPNEQEVLKTETQIQSMRDIRTRYETLSQEFKILKTQEDQLRVLKQMQTLMQQYLVQYPVLYQHKQSLLTHLGPDWKTIATALQHAHDIPNFDWESDVKNRQECERREAQLTSAYNKHFFACGTDLPMGFETVPSSEHATLLQSAVPGDLNQRKAIRAQAAVFMGDSIRVMDITLRIRDKLRELQDIIAKINQSNTQTFVPINLAPYISDLYTLNKDMNIAVNELYIEKNRLVELELAYNKDRINRIRLQQETDARLEAQIALTKAQQAENSALQKVEEVQSVLLETKVAQVTCSNLGPRTANGNNASGWKDVNDALMRLCELHITNLNAMTHSTLLIAQHDRFDPAVRSHYVEFINVIVALSILSSSLAAYIANEQTKELLSQLHILKTHLSAIENFRNLLQSAGLTEFINVFHLNEMIAGLQLFIDNVGFFASAIFAQQVMQSPSDLSFSKVLRTVCKDTQTICVPAAIDANLTLILTEFFMFVSKEKLLQKTGTCSGRLSTLQTNALSNMETNYKSELVRFVAEVKTSSDKTIAKTLKSFVAQWNGENIKKTERIFNLIVEQKSFDTWSVSKNLGEVARILLLWQSVKTKRRTKTTSECNAAFKKFNTDPLSNIVAACTNNMCTDTLLRALLHDPKLSKCLTQKIS